MAQKYFACYHSYLKSTEMLTDAEFGRLIRACTKYSETGEAPELRGNERFLFPMIQQQIDSGKESYEAKCQQNRENAGMRWHANACEGMRDDANRAKEKENKKEKEKKKESVKKEVADAPLSDADALPDSFSQEMRVAVLAWLTYKREKREGYKPAGRKALLSQIENNLRTYSEQDVINLIGECMANGYKGIIWDRLQRRPQKMQTAATYDLDEFENLMKNYVPMR